ncbi:MAG: leucine-rich repeat domain-containing protein [Thermonemataceae bacterium]
MKKILIVTFLMLSYCVSTAQTDYDYKVVEKDGKYIFTDSKGNYVEKLGTWDEIEAFFFTSGELVKVWKESKQYYLDDSGNTYRVAYEIGDKPDPEIEALDLSRQQFDTFPMEVLQYPNLKVLFIDGYYENKNNFVALPAEIVQLKELRFLSLSEGVLTTLPDNLGALKHLQVLYLSENQLKDLPESIGQLQKLKELTFRGNQLKSLPESITKLQKLEM